MGADKELGDKSHKDKVKAREKQEGTQDRKRGADKARARKCFQVNRVEAREETSKDKQQSPAAEEMNRAVKIAIKEVNNEKIEEDAEGAGQTILTPAGGAGRVVNGNFGDFCASPGSVGGEEAVHFAKEREIGNNLFFVGLEGATVVMERNAGDKRDDFISDERGEAAGERTLSPAIEAPAGDEIVTLGHFLEKERDVFGMIFTIAIERDDDLTDRVLYPRLEGGGLTIILIKAD